MRNNDLKKRAIVLEIVAQELRTIPQHVRECSKQFGVEVSENLIRQVLKEYQSECISGLLESTKAGSMAGFNRSRETIMLPAIQVIKTESDGYFRERSDGFFVKTSLSSLRGVRHFLIG